MLLIADQHKLTKRQVGDVIDRLLSGQFKQDGLCRLLSLKNDLNTSEDMRHSLNRAYEMATAGNTKRAVVELRKWLQ